MQNNKLLPRIIKYLKAKQVEVDSKTLNTNLHGIDFVRELLTIPAVLYIFYRNKIANIDGYLSPGQEYFLTKKAYDSKNNSNIVEIGSFKGKSTACFAVGCIFSNKTIFSIDTFRGNEEDFYNFKSGKPYTKGFLHVFKRNLSSLGLLKHVRVTKGLSQDVGKKWNKDIDILFIDGSHIYKDVLTDFNLFYPHVKRGGLIMFHDVVPEFPGVLKVWNKVKGNLKKTNNFASLAYGYKK